MPALLTRPNSVSPAREEPTSPAAALTAGSSVTSNSSGTKFVPSSRLSLSASVALRTLPKTRNPAPTRTFAAPCPMPVEAPVITTDFMGLPFAFACEQYSREPAFFSRDTHDAPHRRFHACLRPQTRGCRRRSHTPLFPQKDRGGRQVKIRFEAFVRSCDGSRPQCGDGHPRSDQI